MPLSVAAFVILNVAVFACEVSVPAGDARDRFVAGFALIPYDFTHGISVGVAGIATLVSAQFLHASALHLAGNMLFLAAFGPDVERICGHLRFAAFYLTCGILGGLAQVSVSPGSHVPEIGASGAIAGVLGAFVLRFPLRLPAVFVIAVWAAVQFAHGFGPVAPGALSERGGSVAYFAHIGGFLAGAVLIGLYTKRPL